jgi:glutamyl-tRNA reductase
MVLVCFTSSHRTAGFDLLERLERRAADIGEALGTHSEMIAGRVVLATCNRFEAYLDIDEPLIAAREVSGETVVAAVSEAAGIDAAELREASRVLCDQQVVEHLFSVSSGLESLVVGEGEIAGQVRRSLDAARAAGTVTRDLERLFQVASRTSRGVKNNTELTRAGRSIVRLALDLAESRVTDWAQTRVLLVGTGAYAGASLAALRERGATDVRVYSRTGRAAVFASKHDIEAVATDALTQAVASADLVVTCSVAPSVILDAQTVADAAALPGALERRLIIDLGLPRNVDPAVAHLPGTELLDLETISVHAPLEELNAADDARAIVGAAAADFAAQTVERSVEPALVALRAYVYDVLDAEIERARKRGDSSEKTEAALRHLAGVLLHTPSVRARELAREGRAESFVDGVGAVFGLDGGEPAITSPAPASLDERRGRNEAVS